MAEHQAKLGDLQKHGKMLKEEVTEEDIAKVVATWTGIPVSRIEESETAKLVHLEERLHERVGGVDHRPLAIGLFDLRSATALALAMWVATLGLVLVAIGLVWEAFH